MLTGIGSSHETPDVYSCCIRYFVWKVVGDSKPKGAKILAISDRTVRFIGLVVEGLALNEKVSANGSHFRPSTLKFDCSLVSIRTEREMARSSSATVCKI